MDEALSCWQCDHRFRAGSDDADEESEIPSRQRVRGTIHLPPVVALRIGIGFLLISAALAAFRTIDTLVVPGVPESLFLQPAVLLLTVIFGVILITRKGPAFAGLGIGVVLFCGYVLGSNFTYVYRVFVRSEDVTGSGLDVIEVTDWSFTLSTVWLPTLIGLTGIAALVLVAMWVVRTRRHVRPPILAVVGAVCYAIGSLVYFVVSLFPPTVPPGFAPLSSTQTIVSVAGNATSLLLALAAIGLTLIAGSAWSVVGIGAAWAAAAAAQVVVALRIGGESLSAGDGFWAAGLMIATIALIRLRMSGTPAVVGASSESDESQQS